MYLRTTVHPPSENYRALLLGYVHVNDTLLILLIELANISIIIIIMNEYD